MANKKILVTGAKGFIGQNLTRALLHNGYEVLSFDKESSLEELDSYLKEAFFVIHLAGVNRSLDEKNFLKGNVDFTKHLLERMDLFSPKTPILFASSVKASEYSGYGRSKRLAEELLLSEKEKRPIYIYRFYNVYGKGSRPNYNSVIATWCDLFAKGEGEKAFLNPADPAIDFLYIDDLCASLIKTIGEYERGLPPKEGYLLAEPHDCVRLSEILHLLSSFEKSKKDLQIPLQNGFERKLYATYLSYLPENRFAYPLESHKDERGSFTELFRFPDRGQVSLNVIHPGYTKGNHYHETKNEKCLCVKGKVLVRLRKLGTKATLEYPLSEEERALLDIPPGYVHSIENLGKEDALLLIWANEPFDPDSTDTYQESVLRKEKE